MWKKVFKTRCRCTFYTTLKEAVLIRALSTTQRFLAEREHAKVKLHMIPLFAHMYF